MIYRLVSLSEMRGVEVAKRREGNEWKPKWLPEPERDRTAVDRRPLQSICLRERYEPVRAE